MAGFVKIGLLALFICQLENFKVSPISLAGSVTGTRNGSESTGHHPVEAAGPGYGADMSREMEKHLLGLLKLSERPHNSVTESAVPRYMRALQLAAEAVPASPSSSFSDGDNQLMWAVKAMQVGVVSDVMTSHFNIAAKSADVTPWRVELVLESPRPPPTPRSSSPLTRPSSRRRRARVDIRGAPEDPTRPARVYSRYVSLRQYTGPGYQYSVYNVTAAVARFWHLCRPRPYHLELRVYGVDHLDVEDTRTMLVMYQNTLPDARATRRALRTVPEPPGQQESLSRTAGSSPSTEGREEKFRRSAPTEDEAYCQPYKWTVNFGVLNWTWVVAPHQFEAGYCAGRCPTNGRDLDQAELSNHAFMRMMHRAWRLDGGAAGLPPAPSCVPVQYRQLSILYQTDDKVFELRHVNEMVMTACGCL